MRCAAAGREALNLEHFRRLNGEQIDANCAPSGIRHCSRQSLREHLDRIAVILWRRWGLGT